MVHQIKAQLNASIEKINTNSNIEKLCSKLSATLAMASALDKCENLDFSESFYENLYSRVSKDIYRVVSRIEKYEKKEETTE